MAQLIRTADAPAEPSVIEPFEGAAEAEDDSDRSAAVAEPRTGRFAALAVLSQRDFRFLFLSSIATGYAQWGQMIGMSWLVYELTGRSAVHLAAVNFVGGFGRLLIGPFVGVALDRWHRRSILMTSTMLSAVQALLLAVLVLTDLVAVWQVFIFAALDALLSTTNQNARQAFVYDVTGPEALPDAIAVNSMMQNITRITGPTLAGALIGAWGTAAPFLMIASTMTLGVLTTLPISRQTRQGARATGHPLANLRDGFVYVARDRRLLGLTVVMSFTALLVYPYLTFLPIFAAEVLHAGSGGYGTLAAAAGIGSLLGLFGLVVMRRVEHRAVVLMFGLLFYFVCLIAFTRATNLWIAAALLAVGGMPHAIAQTMLQMLQQLLPVNEMRGRVTGVVQTAFALYPLGALPMGFAISRWGAPDTCLVSFSAATVLLLCAITGWKSLRTV
ncbi:MAG: MFS transporter [Dehalococcoidia bacterium]